MTMTVIGLYEDFSNAQSVVTDLVSAGVQRDNISLVARDADERYARYADAYSRGERVDDDVDAGEGAGFGAVAGALTGLAVALIPGIGGVVALGPWAAALLSGIGAAAGAATGGITAALVDLGVSDDDAGAYAEGVRRGGTLVVVKADDAMAQTVEDIMNRHNPINVQERRENWTQSGWTGFDESADTYTAARITEERSTYASVAPRTTDYASADYDAPVRTGSDQEVIDIVEEEMQVGKRTVDAGGVRIRKYVTERPVEEQVSLRQETIDVERHPVNRPATDADFNAFEEGTIEVRAQREEAVISKQARVVEEVVISKDVEDELRTIRDTVRRTEVEVDQNVDYGTRETLSGRFGGYETFDADFRTDYNTRYANSGYTYEQYSPAYRYGHTLATTPGMQGDWATVEPQAREYWERTNQGTWEDFKDAVRSAWERVTSDGRRA